MKNMFVNVFVKDYELELDGKVITISGERCLVFCILRMKRDILRMQLLD